MKNTKQFQQVMLFLFLVLTPLSYANKGDSAMYHSDVYEMDSLVLYNTKSTAYYMIPKSQKIKIWSNGKSYKGQFISVKNGRVSVQTKVGIVYIAVNSITKVKDLGDPVKAIVGGLVMSGGIYATAASSVILGVSVWSLLQDGYLFVVYTAPLVLISVGIIKLGDSLRGPEFKMRKNWTIVER